VAAISFPVLVSALPLGAWAETASLDWSVFGMAMVVAVGAALAISGVPILALWRGRLRGTLVSGRTTGVAGRGVRLESSLVVAEVALAVLMTAGAGVLTRSVARLYAIDPGLDARGVGVVDVVLPSDLPDAQRKQMLRELVAEVRAVPGVENVAVVQRLPLRGGSWSSGIAVEGKPDLAATTTYVRFVSPGYLETMGMVLSQGRMIEEPDMANSPADSADGVVVITEALARKYFAGENPLGRRVNVGFGPGNVRVIGVVRDVAEGDLTEGPAAVRYMPYESISFMASGQTLVFRASGGLNPVSLLQSVRGAITHAAPRVAIAEATTMQQVLALAVGPVRQIMTLVTWLTGLALVLGAIGIYGVMSHFVARRKRDWGIRIALGLRPSRVISGIVRRGTVLVVVGIGIGLGVFVLLARLLTPLIYGVGPTDPLAIMVAIVALLLVGVLAAWLPAARASRTDPVIVLREQ
jgi:predicted permease